MKNARILIVEDEAPLREMISYAMSTAGFVPVMSEDVDQAYGFIDSELPDLILLDWMLPGLSGVEFAKRLRRDEYTREVPIVMLTARSDEADKLAGFEAGVDDYVVKPFSPRELIARIKAVLRRTSTSESAESLSFGGLTLEPDSHRVSVNGTPLKLGPTEFALLRFFLEHPDRVYNRGQLLDRVWGRSTSVEERTVDVHILRLRKALKPFFIDHYVQTVRSAGYRFSLADNP
ncbi:MAG: phosphate regulon transcriptional regulator PhoB [Thiotrichales bacterium]